MNRAALLEFLADRIARVQRPHPVRVAIDGVDGVGKTVLGDELVGPLSRRGRPVIRASVDGFHNPRRVRYQLGRDSVDGYFRDSFNYPALIEALLTPLGPGGTRTYRRAIFEYRTDQAVHAAEETAATDSVLLFDGIFLHRPELLPFWDLSIFLHAPLEATIARVARRGGGSAEVDAPENRRYVEGQRLYLRTCEPQRAASIVVDNEDVESPEVLRA